MKEQAAKVMLSGLLQAPELIHDIDPNHFPGALPNAPTRTAYLAITEALQDTTSDRSAPVKIARLATTLIKTKTPEGRMLTEDYILSECLPHPTTYKQALEAHAALSGEYVREQTIHYARMLTAKIESGENIGEAIQEFKAARHTLLGAGAALDHDSELAVALQTIRETRNKREVYSTGFDLFDEISGGGDPAHGGLRPGTFVGFGARANVGKTRIMWHIASNLAADGHEVHFFGLESTRAEFQSLGLSRTFERPRRDIRQYADDTLDHVHKTAPRKPHFKLYTRKIAGRWNQISTHIRRAAALRGERPLFVFLDYLQLISGRGRSEDRYEFLSRITEELGAMSKELDITICVAIQINRTGGDQEPRLHHLKGSGQIEQALDECYMIWNKDPEADKLITIKCAKHRSARRGTAVDMEANFGRFQFTRY